MKTVCECGHELINNVKYKPSKAFSVEVEDIESVTIYSCPVCNEKSFKAGEDRVAKQHLALWADEMADAKHERRGCRD